MSRGSFELLHRAFLILLVLAYFSQGAEKAHKEIFYAATAQRSLIEDTFFFCLKKEFQIFKRVSQNQRAGPSYLSALTFDSHTVRNPSQKIKRFLLLPLFSHCLVWLEKRSLLCFLTSFPLMARTLCTFVGFLKASKDMWLYANILRCVFILLILSRKENPDDIRDRMCLDVDNKVNSLVVLQGTHESIPGLF